jgi:hypothetical protein
MVINPYAKVNDIAHHNTKTGRGKSVFKIFF